MSTSPLSQAAERLKASLAQGYALPSSWYTDRDWFAKERDVVLRRSWHYVAHTGELASVGDQVVGRIAGVPIVLVRDESAIRGFINICRHRAHQVVLRNQNQQSLQCMYHGWTYGLDGCLRAAPRSKLEPEFEVSEYPLIPIEIGMLGPTIWANLDHNAPAFETWIKGLPELIAHNGFDVEAHRFAFEKRWKVAANWKVFLDNAIECYHCPTCHPTLARALEMDPRQHALSVGGRYWSSHTIPFRASGHAASEPVDGAAPGAASRPLYHFHWIFPNTFFQYTTLRRGFDIGSVDVKGVNDIEFRNLFFVPRDMTDSEVETFRKQCDQDPVVGEDVGICERVQVAHEAGLLPAGRLLPGSEWLLQHFQRVLVGMMEAHL